MTHTNGVPTGIPTSGRWARLCFGAIGVVCALVLLSWIVGRWQLGALGSQYVPMAPSTAISMLALAAAAWLWQSRPESVFVNRLGRAVAVVVLLASVLVWVEFRFGIEFPSVGPRTPETIGQIPVGRMSPLTAAAFLLASLGLLLQLLAAGRRALRQAAAILLVVLLMLSAGVALSYVLRVPLFYSGNVIPMAALTAIGLTLLGIGLLLRTGADTWPMGLLIHHAPERTPSRTFTWGFFALALVLVAGIGASGYAYLLHERSEARRVAVESVSAVADLKVGEIAEWYRERRAEAVTISATPVQAELDRFLADASASGTRDRLLAWLGAIQQETGDSTVALVDDEGTILLSVPPSPFPLDVHVVEACREALRRRAVVIQDLHRHESDQRVYLSHVVPFAGLVLLLQIDAERSLFPRLATWPTRSPSAETTLARREGDEVLFLSEPRHQQGAAMNLRIRIDEMPDLPAGKADSSGKIAVLDGRDYRGVPVVAAVRTVPGTPWILVAKIDQEEVMAPFRREMSTTIPMLAVLLLAAVTGVSLLWYRRGLAAAEREIELQRRSLESEAALRDREQLLSEMGRVAKIGGWEFDPATGKGTWTAEVARIHGLDPAGETNMQRGLSFYQGESRARIEQAVKDAVELGRDYDLQLELVTEEGVHKWVQTIGHPTMENGKVVRVSGSFQDISDQKMVEEQIRQLNEELEQRVAERTAQLEIANRELESFSYSVSHDLRAPLRGIDGWSVALLEDYGPALDDRARQYLARVRAETQRMAALIDDMLKLSRVTRQEMQPAPLDLSSLAATITRKLRESEPARAVEIVIEPGLSARGDAGLVEAALSNLFENAWKFTRKQPAARIVLGRMDQGGETVFFVRDNGVGFDMTYAGKLFSPFQRLHKASEFPGTGVGLATVQRVVHRHGGRIWAEAAVDRGATFYFTLEAKG